MTIQNVPGMGTLVRYHYSTDVDVPAVVIATIDDWNSNMTTAYGNSGPMGTDKVFLYTLSGGNIGAGVVPNVTEGTSVGQFSLITTEVEAD